MDEASVCWLVTQPVCTDCEFSKEDTRSSFHRVRPAFADSRFAVDPLRQTDAVKAKE